ncbi:MAG: hypothetical protein QW373_06450 [Desulfurococcaceae archaeon]
MSNKYVRVQALIPREWYPIVKKIMEKKGYVSVSEYVRDLVRRSIEAEGND